MDPNGAECEQSISITKIRVAETINHLRQQGHHLPQTEC
jgi:hypothetical protein